MGIEFLNKQRRGNLLITVILIFLLSIGMFLVINKTESQSKKMAFRDLERTTEQLGADFKEHIIADREQLRIMANVMANMMPDNSAMNEENIRSLFKGFVYCQHMHDVDILLPDGRLISLREQPLQTSELDFAEEAEKGEYITTMTESFSGGEEKVIYNVVPVVSGDETRAIIYGRIDAEDMKQLLSELYGESSRRLFLIAGNTGEFVADAGHNDAEDLGILKIAAENGEYASPDIADDFRLGRSGFVKAYSRQNGEYYYSVYNPVGINDLMVLVYVSETEILEPSKEITIELKGVLVLFSLMLFWYFIWILWREVRKTRRNNLIRSIERTLYEGYTDQTYLTKAVKMLCEYKEARSAFFITMDGNHPGNIYEWAERRQDRIAEQLSEEFFVKPSAKTSAQNKTGILFNNKKLHANRKKTAAFMENNGYHRILYTVLVDLRGVSVGIMCVLEPKTEKNDAYILEELSNSFSMAIKNTEYFSAMKKAGIEDNLTGLYNRHKYHETLMQCNEKALSSLACIYVDVNGLHVMNNTYGHTAGDAMLIRISEIMKNNFGKENCFRIGGDEFTVIAENISKDEASRAVKCMEDEVRDSGYSVSIGCKWRDKNIDTELMMKEAEKEMYDRKYQYYMDKQETDKAAAAAETGKWEFVNVTKHDSEALLSVIAPQYLGVYIVDMKTDSVRSIYLPTYFSTMLDTTEGKFSSALKIYINKVVNPEYARKFTPFFDYEWLESRLIHNGVQTITYDKINGIKVRMSVHRVNNDRSPDREETIWIFEAIKNL